MKKIYYVVLITTDGSTTIEKISITKSTAVKSFKEWIEECWHLEDDEMSQAMQLLDYSQDGQRIYIVEHY